MGETRFLGVRRLKTLALTALVALSACSPVSGTHRGVVVGVEGTLSEVSAFTLLVEGDTIRYLPVADGDYVFPLPHLREHQRAGEPVEVGWELVDDQYLAISLHDG